MTETTSGIFLLDGAMGTMLQAAGLKPGESPEVLNITNPEAVKNVHRQYFAAGSDMVMANTFGASEKKLASTGYGSEEIIKAAVRIAREAAKEFNGKVALDLGSLGELLEPAGTLTFDEAYEQFKTQITVGAAAGIDAIAIETMTDLLETKCALLAAKENSSLPVYCTMSYESGGRTFMGVSLPAMALTLEGLGADAIGLNCSVGPAEMYDMVLELRKWTNLPIIAKPNAGLPELRDGKTVFSITASEFADHINRLLDLGVAVIGGCCGTTPDFIKELKKLIQKRSGVVNRPPFDESAVCSYSTAVKIDRVRIVGERINPTGRKKLQQALLNGDMDYLTDSASEQVEAGADILDVNVGYPKIDERAVMVEAVQSIQSVTGTPLSIDSVKPEVMAAALRVYNGKPIINSVTGEAGALEKILPLAKKYGAMVIGLTLDERGIPRTAAGRVEIAERIVAAALGYGIPRRDIIIDCLTLTSGAEQEIAYETIEAVRLVKEKLKVKTVLGVSNISFGLPGRDKLNPVFLTLALGAGLDLAIINPNMTEMTDAVCCFHQLRNIDAGSVEYIERFKENSRGRAGDFSEGMCPRTRTEDPEKYLPPLRSAEEITEAGNGNLARCVANGLKDEIKTVVKDILQYETGLAVVDKYLIPALDAVGKNYETGRIFLPQLLRSAEAAKAAFEVIKEAVAADGAPAKGDKIILATVKGDIHDIGKNIVKVVLENYGYDVIDLGRDAEAERVTASALENQVKLVGLSALMTTTVDSMEDTIRAIRVLGQDVKVMVGGAVLTAELAEKIGADFYASDAMEAVKIAKGVFE